MWMKQTVLPVIDSFTLLKRFFNTSLTWCIVMDFHMNTIAEVIKEIHQHQRKVIIHMDLIHGLANDQYGAQYMCQTLHVDGIISTKAKTIEAAKQNHCVSILRTFMIDSRSLQRSLQLANQVRPDYIEVLPAMLPGIVSRISKDCSIPVIGGGLITSKEDKNHCLQEGMIAVSCSRVELWEV